MELILLRDTRTGHRRTHLGRIATVLVLLVVLGAVGGAFHLGHSSAPPAPDPRTDLYAAAVEAHLAMQQAEIDEAVANARRHLDALALEVGELEARIVRVDALGERLVTMAALDDTEFRFDATPPMGGPDPGAAAASNEVPDFLRSLERLSRRLEDRQPKLAAMESALMDRRLAWEVRPEGRPVRSGWLSSRFGFRTDPVTGRRALHRGLDYAGRPGSDVIAVASGVVVYAGRRRGFGNVVEIHHGNGYTTRYAHNKENVVETGQTVRKGDVVALMGSSGRTTGTHVHFELRHNGRAVDPLKLFDGR